MDKQREYMERLSAHMAEWDVQIDLIKDKVESISPETRSEYSKAISALMLKRNEVAVRMHGTSTASDEQWEKIKIGTEHILGEVRTLFRAAITTIE